MHRRFSAFVRSPGGPGPSRAAEYDDEDTESKLSATTVGNEVLAPAATKVKKVDFYYSRWSKAWKYRNTSAKVTVETLPVLSSGSNDPWKDFSFVVVRTIPEQDNQKPTFKIVVKSEYILKACQDVIQTWPGVSWNAEPLELDPEMFLTWIDSFVSYRDELAARKTRSDLESNILSSVNTLLNFLYTDYRSTITTIERLTAHAEITWDLLYAIFVPRSLLVARCAVTGLERLFELQYFMRTSVDGIPCYQLVLESVDLVDRPFTQSVGVGRVSTCVVIRYFKGAARIDALDAFPLKFHSAPAQLKKSIMERGRKWVELIGMHHMEYNGIAALKVMGKLMRHNVKGRIMVDRATFHRLNPNYQFPTPVPPKSEHGGQAFIPGMLPHPAHPMPPTMARLPPPPPPRGLRHQASSDSGWGAAPTHVPQMIPPMPMHMMGTPWVQRDGALVQTQTSAEEGAKELKDEDLLLTPTVVYGFSLADKIWVEFDVTKVQPVSWNADAFANLVLPVERKTLLRSLVEAHHEESGFDDFVKGKGAGLVVNLFGPPGVGKTFSAEATSEHVRRPLYVIGGGDLGTRAGDLDSALERVFDVATAWKAIVLIDEADVFLERRSMHDLERNAMVAVFLRHLEWYRGILFLTTNRVQAFDEAFLSRIHVALHFSELSESSRAQVWRAFIAKGGLLKGISEADIAAIAKRPVNGRQIKNAVRTAHSIAMGRREAVGLRHFEETLDAMDEFTERFDEMKVVGGDSPEGAATATA
ncbi:hypothetical protein FB45DRAFT_244515 [Roridomyces roridus]|uniref:AAA+ ATPase domain-containing protein n=1 Tax=Roridomyces roridus TaxID=1738132 RepID=A0AAD7BB00_9AGAR|nr:hypothetical protein FB45DRAFT_244515 [Roridomyces roridus]